jgi:hypothetical protein
MKVGKWDTAKIRNAMQTKPFEMEQNDGRMESAVRHWQDSGSGRHPQAMTHYNNPCHRRAKQEYSPRIEVGMADNSYTAPADMQIVYSVNVLR